jgi:hypothetical protein
MRTSFDYVELVVPGGASRRLTEREFQALPLADRIRAILGGQLRFFRGDKLIAMKDALGD